MCPLFIGVHTVLLSSLLVATSTVRGEVDHRGDEQSEPDSRFRRDLRVQPRRGGRRQRYTVGDLFTCLASDLYGTFNAFLDPCPADIEIIFIIS